MFLIDYIIIIISITYAILGFIKGFSKQLISFLVWITFLFVLFNNMSEITNIVSSYISVDKDYIKIISLIVLLTSTILIIFLLNFTLSKIIAVTLFENSNKILGLLASLIKVQIYIFIFILLIQNTAFHSTLLNESVFVPYYLNLVEYISIYDDSLFNSFQI